MKLVDVANSFLDNSHLHCAKLPLRKIFKNRFSLFPCRYAYVKNAVLQLLNDSYNVT